MIKLFYILGIIMGFSIGVVLIFGLIFVIYDLIQKHKSRKHNIEKLIDEEIKKGDK